MSDYLQKCSSRSTHWKQGSILILILPVYRIHRLTHNHPEDCIRCLVSMINAKSPWWWYEIDIWHVVCRKIVSTLSWRENVKEQLFQRTQAENTEGEKTWVKDNCRLRISSLVMMLKVQIHVGWRFGWVGTTHPLGRWVCGWVGGIKAARKILPTWASILRLEANLLIAKVF